MHVVKLYSIYDRKAQYYLPLMQHRAEADAIREFTDICFNGDLPIAKYPADFDLIELGEWGTGDGAITPSTHPVPIINGLVAIQNAQAERRRYQAILEPSHTVAGDEVDEDAFTNGASS